MEERSHRIDALKGIAIFMVLLGHAIILFPVDLHEVPSCRLVFDLVSSLHMELFFVISGFCYHCRGSYGEFLKKKLLRLGVPYLIFNLLDMVPRQLMAAVVNRPRPMGESLGRMALLGGELWFLYVLMVIFLFFPLVDRLCRKVPGGELVLVAAALALLGVHGRLPQVFLLDRVGLYLFYFSVGYALRRREGWIKENLLPRLKGPWGLGCLAVWWGLFYLERQRPLFFPLHAVLVLAGCAALWQLAGQEWVAKVLAGPGRYSLQLYVLNGFTLVASRVLACNVLGLTSPWGIVAVNMAGTFGAGYAFTVLALDRLPLTRVLCGLPAKGLRGPSGEIDKGRQP